MRVLFFVLSFFLLAPVGIGQVRKVYGRDFDYRTLFAKDTVSANALPRNYVCCTYQGSILTDIDIFRQEDWMKEPLQTHARVVRQGKHTFFIYDAGKTKSGGYGRLFSKKIQFSDTAMFVNDTLIYKRTTPISVYYQYATGIYSDSIVVNDKTFGGYTKKELQTSPLMSFANYTLWPLVDTYTRYYQIAITPSQQQVVKAKRMIADGTADYSFGYAHSQDYFTQRGIPASLFWIKHLGLIY